MLTEVQGSAWLVTGWYWQPILAWYGLTLLVLVPAGAVWGWYDPRSVEGESVALKPIRFALSIGVYMLTTSAMFAFVRPDRRAAILSLATVWLMVAGSTVELACITFQAMRARRSHFNVSSPADAAIYATMGAFALLFIGAVLPLAWEIALRPNEQAYPIMARAIVIGLLMTGVFGGGTGALMSVRGRPEAQMPGRRLPLLGWSISGDDLRLPHFLGIHAMQAVPLIAAGAMVLDYRQAALLSAIGTVAYGAVTAGLLFGALRVRPSATK